MRKIFSWFCFILPTYLVSLPAENDPSLSSNPNYLYEETQNPIDLPRYAPSPSWNFSFGSGLVYWKANHTPGIGEMKQNRRSMRTKSVKQDYSYHPGLQFFVVYSPNEELWDATCTYTWYRSLTDQVLQTKNTQVIIPHVFETDMKTQFASLDWLVQLDLFDAELGKEFVFEETWICRPFIGSRFYVLDQQFAIEATSFPFVQLMEPREFDLVVLSQHSEYSSQSWALGTRFGVDVHALLGYGVRAFLNTSGSILYFDCSDNYRYETNTLGESKRFHLEQDEFLRTNLEMSTGFGWGGLLAQDRIYLDISALFDLKAFNGHHLFYSNSFVKKNQVDEEYGNLYLIGGTLRLRFDF
ncbi:MAG: Lpg1974 family pore-forming outer membrane protein [Chlamydiota bacterium]